MHLSDAEDGLEKSPIWSGKRDYKRKSISEIVKRYWKFGLMGWITFLVVFLILKSIQDDDWYETNGCPAVYDKKFTEKFKNWRDYPLHHLSHWDYVNDEQWNDLHMKSLSFLTPKVKDGAKVLELGAGVGAFLKVIDNNFKNIEIWGSDVCPGPIGVAKQVFPEQKDHFIVADAKDWRPEIMAKEKFDHVFANFVMTYMKTEEDAIEMLKNMLRATKKGGSILVGFNRAVDTENVHFLQRKSSILKFWTRLQTVLGYKITSIQYGSVIHSSQGDRYFIYIQKL